MVNLRAELLAPWGGGTTLRAEVLLPWGSGVMLYSTGNPYTAGPPPVTGAPLSPEPPTPGAVLPGQPPGVQVVALSLVDERTGLELQVTELDISASEDSAFWNLRAACRAEAYAALTTGEQPVTVLATLNGLQWRFVVDTVTRQRGALGEVSASITGRSPSVVAGQPYQVPENWSTQGLSTAQQICVSANAFTGLTVDWGLDDWLVPQGAFSFTGTPLDVVRAVAASVGALVVPDRLEPLLRVRPRWTLLPAEWPVTPPDVEIHADALLSESLERVDRPQYNGVFLAGQQNGIVGYVRRAGTNGARLHPLVTDALLSSVPALRQRGESILGESDVPARSTVVLPVLTGDGEPGVLTVGQTLRVLDTDATWWGQVARVQVQASIARLVQTVGAYRLSAPPAFLDVPLLQFNGPIPDQVIPVGEPFDLPLAGYWEGGFGAIRYSRRSGDLPPGLTLDAVLGRISGTPATAGVWPGYSVRATDDAFQQADSNSFVITVEEEGCDFEPLLPEDGQAPNTTVYTAGTELTLAALASFEVYGGEMAGMEVTVVTDLGTEVRYWAANDWTFGIPWGGAVSGTDWLLQQAGPTGSFVWILQSTGGRLIHSVRINAAVGNIVFDTGRMPKAPGSDSGASFEIQGGLSGQYRARYSHRVEVASSGNQDLFACLAVTFDPPFSDGNLFFIADTDQPASGVEFECG